MMDKHDPVIVQLARDMEVYSAEIAASIQREAAKVTRSWVPVIRNPRRR